METAEELVERIGEDNEHLLWQGAPIKSAKIKSDIIFTIVLLVVLAILAKLWFGADLIIYQVIIFIPIFFIVLFIVQVLMKNITKFERLIYIVTNERIIVRNWSASLDYYYINQIQFPIVGESSTLITCVDFCTGYKVGKTDKIINKKRLCSFDHILHSDAIEVRDIVNDIIKKEDAEY